MENLKEVLKKKLEEEKSYSEIRVMKKEVLVWHEFLKKKRDEGKREEFKEEIETFIEILKLKKEKRSRDSKYYEHPEEATFVITEKIKKKIDEYNNAWSKKWDNFRIKQCWEIKQKNPKISLRKLGEKFHRNKDTISKWLKKAETNPEIIAIKDGSEETEKEYMKDVEKLIEQADRWEAMSKGVKDKDYIAWINSGMDYDGKHHTHF